MSSAVGAQFQRLAVVTGVAALLLAGCVFDMSGLPLEDGTISPSCGNGVIGESETCDDGNSLGGDGCNAACQPEAGWQCGGEPSVCTPLCGDGLVRGDEVCDDGNTANGDGCTGQCDPEPGWTCFGQPSQCANTCGNGQLDAGEECDDANLVENDGCSASCRIDENWVCSGVPSICTPNCGDGWILGTEECDDGNTVSGDGCSVSCVVEPGWICSGVPSDCAQVCGDGITGPGEQCDDGNTAPDDGCSPNCQQEPGWACNGSPSVCQVLCGDGLVVAGEGCDDGATVAGDGCSPTCQLEDFHACYGEPSQCVCVVYVDQRAVPNARTGTTWQSALAGVQQGIDAAAFRAQTAGTCEVWVATGRYHVYQTASTDTIDLASDVTVFGGFSGLEIWRSQRNISANETILDGTQSGNPAFRVKSVVTGNALGGAGLDGVTVSNGGISTGDGGGAYFVNCDLSLNQVSFVGNIGRDGGGVHVQGGSATMTNCTFGFNTASSNGGGSFFSDTVSVVNSCHFDTNTAVYGAGVLHTTGTVETSSSVFQNNHASHSGGGIYLYDSDATVTACDIIGNIADVNGGGMRAVNGTLTLVSAVLAQNEADRGGALENYTTNGSWVYNCTFYGNTAVGGEGLGGGVFTYSSSFMVANSIFWSNLPSQITDSSGSLSVIYSDVQGGIAGAGNINAAPMFVDALADDYDLQSGSPCIDAADGAAAPATDIDGNPRYDDPAVVNTGTGSPAFVDIGAYERQP